MTHEEAKEIGLRAMACNQWRWLPGMRIWNEMRGFGAVVVGIEPSDSPFVTELIYICTDEGDFIEIMPSGADQPMSWLDELVGGFAWPDLRDPATFGAVYGVWQSIPGHTYRCPCAVMTYASALGMKTKGAAEALVKSLEAA